MVEQSRVISAHFHVKTVRTAQTLGVTGAQ